MLKPLGLLKRSFYRLLVGAGVHHWQRRRHAHELLIVMYHGLTECPDKAKQSWLLLPTNEFASQIAYLKENYDILPLTDAVRELKSAHGLTKPTACITFDDGYLNNYTLGLPILQQHRAPATIFLPTGFIGADRLHWTPKIERAVHRSPMLSIDLRDIGLGILPLDGARSTSASCLISLLYRLPDADRQCAIDLIITRLRLPAGWDDDFSEFRFMNWDQVRAMHASGLVEFGGHTIDHVVVSPLTQDEIWRQIHGSIEQIKSEVGLAADAFAYPNGAVNDFDDRAIAILKDLNVACAVSTLEGLNNANANVHALRRIPVENMTSLTDFKLHTSGVIVNLRQWFRGAPTPAEPTKPVIDRELVTRFNSL